MCDDNIDVVIVDGAAEDEQTDNAVVIPTFVVATDTGGGQLPPQ